MATVAATIGLRGRRPHLTLDYDAAHGRAASTERATSAAASRARWSASCSPSCAAAPACARRSPGVLVAGKTGTAELRTTKKCEPDPEHPESCPPEDQANDPTDTDAWFAAYAPAGKGRPHVAVGVLLRRPRAPAATPRRPRRATRSLLEARALQAPDAR